MPTLELNPNKQYTFPKEIYVEQIDDQFLIILQNTANWILAQNKKQVEMFRYLESGKTVLELFQNFQDKKDIIYLLTELEAKHIENTSVHYPEEHGMYMYLTNRCNQRCKHCYMFAGDCVDDELTTEEIQKILCEFAKHKGKVVTFTGGEATLRTDFTSIIRTAKENGLIVGVLSNGLMWNREFVNNNKAYIDEVQISIDGYDAESYKTVRKTDTFHIALETVDILINAGIRVTVAITPLLDTLLGNEENYITFANALSEKYKGKEFFVKFNTELMEGRNIDPTAQENEVYRKTISVIKTACSQNSEEEGFAIDHRNNTIFNNCGYGGITVAANGDVFFCNLISECAKQANVRENSFEDILALSKQAREASDINNLRPCNKCALKYICGGGCRVKNFKKLVMQKEYNNHNCVDRDVLCTKEYRDKLYRLMVKSNKLFYL